MRAQCPGSRAANPATGSGSKVWRAERNPGISPGAPPDDIMCESTPSRKRSSRTSSPGTPLSDTTRRADTANLQCPQVLARMARVTTGLRERKKLATRAALHEAALRLVAERGLEAVSVDDIADRVDVSPRTFFNYFPTKVDAILGLDPDAPRRQADAFLDRPAEESAVQALRAVAREQAVEMAEDMDLWPLRLKVIDANPALLAHLAVAFSEAEGI